MARLEAAVYSILSGDANIVALVSTRIYPLFLPQDCVLPAMTYYRVTTDRESAFITDPGLSTVRISIDILGTTASSVMEIAEKVRAALHRYRGTIAGVTIEESHVEMETSIYEPDTETHRIVLDFMISQQET